MTNEQKEIVKEIEQACTTSLKGFNFQSVDDETFEYVTKVLIDTVESFYTSNKIAKFEVICDWRNNFIATAKLGELHSRVVIAFKRFDMQRIVLDFVNYPLT